MSNKLIVKKIDTSIPTPSRAHPTDAGIDLYSAQDILIFPSIYVDPSNMAKIRTGIAIELPQDHVGIIHDRSSVGSHGIKVMGGVIDEGYRGEIIVCLANISDRIYKVKKGDKIAQMVVYPIAKPEIVVADELSESDRGQNGFGSTGK